MNESTLQYGFCSFKNEAFTESYKFEKCTLNVAFIIYIKVSSYLIHSVEELDQEWEL